MFIIHLFLLEYRTLFLKNVYYNLGTVAFGHYGRRVRRYVCIRRTRFSTEPLERPVQTCLVRDIIIVVPQCSGLAFSFHNVWLYFFWLSNPRYDIIRTPNRIRNSGDSVAGGTTTSQQQVSECAYLQDVDGWFQYHRHFSRLFPIPILCSN